MEEEEGRWIRGSIINICEYECISCVLAFEGEIYTEGILATARKLSRIT